MRKGTSKATIILASLCLMAAFTTLTVQAQPSEFELSEFPPYLDPPVNTQIGVSHFAINYAIGGATRRPSDNVKFLNSAYKMLRQAGYDTPPLSPRIKYEETGETLYRVFQFDFSANPLVDKDGDNEYDASDLGVYIEGIDCDTVSTTVSKSGFKNWIAINSNAPPKAPYQRMQTLSHELFHAFQDAYPMFGSNCVDSVKSPPNWITEGLADAAANILTEHRFTSAWMSQGEPDYLSLRSYRIAFQDSADWLTDPYFRSDVAPQWSNYNPKGAKGNAGELQDVIDTMGYHSSGFWQFLARRSTGKFPRSSSQAEISELLATWIPLMQAPLPGFLSESKGWLREVNDYVEQYLPLQNKYKGNALYGWFPEFVTEYATWWEQRHSQASKQRWLDYAFGGCETVTLKPGKSSSGSSRKITLTNFRKNSARCIDVKLTGFTNPISIKVKAEYDHARRADQIHLGLARVEAPSGSGKKVSSCWDHWDSNRLECMRMAKPANEPPSKTWKEDQYSTHTLNLPNGTIDATLTYVISNVALLMDETETMKTLDLTFSTSYVYGGGKKFAPPKSIHPINPTKLSQIMTNKKEIFYRLYTSAPFSITNANLFDIELNQIEDGEQPRCGGDDKDVFCAYYTGGDFYIKPGGNISFGQTGRIHAAVYKMANNGNPSLMSTYCSQDADLKAVEILDSNEGGLVVRINTDLCEGPEPANNFCNLQLLCPVRDHLITTLTLALGREHFAETAPIHVLTPGTKFDIDLYYRYGVPTESFVSPSAPSSSSGSGSGTTSGPAPSGSGTSATGTSTSSGGTLNACTCSCEELADFDNRAEEAKKVGDNDATMALAGQMMGCMGQCEREYMICRMDNAEVEKQEKELLRKQEAEAMQANCDCSCEALDDIVSGGQEFEKKLQKQFAEGSSISNEDIIQLTQCFSVCQQEVIACAMKK